MKPGLYDKNDNLIKSWDELISLGLNVEKDCPSMHFSSDKTTFYFSYILFQ